MNKNKAYSILIAILLASNGIKYGASGTNPFQRSTPTIVLFLTAVCCHVLASTADMNLPATAITFHLSGTLACQSLLWITLSQILWYCITNILLLVVASICFFSYLVNITQLFSPSPSNANEMLTVASQKEDQV